MMNFSKGLLDYALNLGADYAAVLYHTINSATITVENGTLKGFEAANTRGVGIRTVVDEMLGIASSTSLKLSVLKQKVGQAVRMAKAARGEVEPYKLVNIEPHSVKKESPFKVAPEDVPDDEKIALVLEANKSASLEGIENSMTYLGWLKDSRMFTSSEGAEIELTLRMTGLGQLAVAKSEGRMEFVSDSESRCAGFEFIEKMDWPSFTKGVADIANKAVKAKSPETGNYCVVADPDLIGLILHEALGHSAEGDLVTTKESVLENKIGQEIASPKVTIVDEGVVNEGYYIPYDDEGVPKGRTVIVDEGVLEGYLQSRSSASKLKAVPTGNTRVQNYASRPLVRQTNFMMEGGDFTLEELVEDIEEGIYICGRGARGGEVDVGQGTYTFRAGPSYAIKRGEIREIVRGVSLSGMVLETLKQVSAVGREVKVRTSIFGGCGKEGQRAHVGHGGPHVKIERMSVGGGT